MSSCRLSRRWNAALPRHYHRAVIEGGTADRIGGGQRQLVPQLLAGDDALVEELAPFLGLGLRLNQWSEGIQCIKLECTDDATQIRST